MKKRRSLKELGFKKQPKEKHSGVPTESRGKLFPNSNAISIEELSAEYQSRLIHPTPDAPPDTDVGSGHNVESIEKSDEGFKTWGKEWREGYPR